MHLLPCEGALSVFLLRWNRAPSSVFQPLAIRESISGDLLNGPIRLRIGGSGHPKFETVMSMEPTSYKVPRGFAAMDPAKQREIARKGGKSSGGNFAHDRERAAAAGRKGGSVSPKATSERVSAV